MEEFGSYLKAHREKKGIRLEEIASITKIHLHNLELLESGKMDSLPPEPFIRGFITAYAKYVGLSPKETIEKYLTAAGITAPEAETTATRTDMGPASPSTPRSMSAALNSTPISSSSSEEVMGKFQLPSWPKLVTAAGVFFVAGVSILLIQIGRNADAPTETAGIPTQVEMMAEKPVEGDARNVAANATPPLVANPAANPTAPAQAPAPAIAPTTAAPASAAASNTGPAQQASAVNVDAKAHNIEIEGADRTWVKVVVDNEAPVEFFLSPGKKVQYSASQKVKVVLGNATNAKVTHNGTIVDGKRFMGTIKSFRFPANAQFPQDVPKPAAAPATEGDNKSEE